MDFLHQLLGNDLGAGLFTLLTIIVIESLLSVDNAAVLATMVMDLPKDERDKALKYGIFGAYFFRGICMIFASWLIKIWWLKPFGGLYLIWLAYSFFKGQGTSDESDDYAGKKSENWLYKLTIGSFGTFWATVALVELMDMAFSIDNIFAVVAITKNIYLICLGVFVGILAMRFVAQFFVKLMEQYNFLENIAFLVIGFLGVKLALSGLTHFIPESGFAKIIESEAADMGVSIITILAFVIPIASAYFFNFPKKNEEESE